MHPCKPGKNIKWLTVVSGVNIVQVLCIYKLGIIIYCHTAVLTKFIWLSCDMYWELILMELEKVGTSVWLIMNQNRDGLWQEDELLILIKHFIEWWNKGMGVYTLPLNLKDEADPHWVGGEDLP